MHIHHIHIHEGGVCVCTLASNPNTHIYVYASQNAHLSIHLHTTYYNNREGALAKVKRPNDNTTVMARTASYLIKKIQGGIR